MDVDTLAPILKQSVTSVIQAMCALEVQSGSPEEKHGNSLFGEVTAIIGMASPKVHASMALSFEKPVILALFSAMLGETIDTIDDEVLDAAGELTNMVCGDLKRRLYEHDIRVEMASPIVISGGDVRVRDRVPRKTWIVPFSTPVGRFVLESNLPDSRRS